MEKRITLTEIEHEIDMLTRRQEEILTETTIMQEKVNEFEIFVNVSNEAVVTCNKLQQHKENVIDKQMQKIWQQIESKWIDWDDQTIGAWFQYKLKNKNKGKIDWDKIENNLKSKEWNGNYLKICNQNELKKLGFENLVDAKYLTIEIKRLLKNSGDENDLNGICSICLTEKTNTIFVPCGHACMCKTCVSQYDKQTGCPICRSAIANVFDMYLT